MKDGKRSPLAPVAGFAVAAVLLAACGNSPADDEASSPGPPYVVDSASVGGRCSDKRKAREARSVRSPWCSLERAVEAAPAGGLVSVRRGTYRKVELRGKRSQTLRFRAHPGERVELQGIDITRGPLRIEGFAITGAVNVGPDASGVAIVRNRIITNGKHGTGNLNIEPGASDVLIADNRIAQRPQVVGANAINFNSTDTLPEIRNVTIRNNKIGPVIGGDAIQAKHTRKLTVEKNEIFGIVRPEGKVEYHPDALQSIDGAIDLTVRKNFIHDITAQGFNIQVYLRENRNFVAQDNVIVRVGYPYTAFSFNVDGAIVEHNTIDGLMVVELNTRKAKIVGNVITYGLTPAPEAQIEQEDHNLAQRFTIKTGDGSIVGKPTYRAADRNDFSLAPGSPGYRAGPDGEDLGARRPTFPKP